MTERIRSWPTWIRYGIISALVALVFGSISYLIDSGPIGLPSAAPFLLIVSIAIYFIKFVEVLVDHEIFLLLPIGIVWFFIGGALGRFVKKPLLAVVLWLLIYGLGAALAFYWLKTSFELNY